MKINGNEVDKVKKFEYLGFKKGKTQELSVVS